MKLKLIIALPLFQWFSQDIKNGIKLYLNFSDLPLKKKTPSWANQFYDNLDQINVNKLKNRC
jgi:hypothetical protein